MKIVQGDGIALERGLEHRGGSFHFRRLLEGEPGTIGNFQLSYGVLGGDFFSPRHRHNFEQIRFQLAGVADYARDGKLTAGMVGYFPEGMRYGPQEPGSEEDCVTLVLQFGGASGSGYLSRNEVKAGMAELAGEGMFEGGVFRRKDDAEGKRNVDGYQAIWEHVHGRPMEYPAPRYHGPIFMDPETYAWSPVDGQAGVLERLLGVFTECRTEAGLVKLEAGAEFTAPGGGIYFVVSGAGTVGDEPYRHLTTVHLARGETVAFRAETATELLHMGLPDLRHVRAAGHIADAVAAE